MEYIEIINAFTCAKQKLTPRLADQFKLMWLEVPELLNEIRAEVINTLAEELASEFAEGDPLFDYWHFIEQLEE